MEKSLKRLLCKQNTLKGQLVRFQNYLKCEELNITELETRLSQTEPFLTEYHELNIEISCYEDTSGIEHSEDVEDFEKLYFSSISQAKEILEEHRRRDRSSQSSEAENLTVEKHHDCCSSKSSNILKLPQISLPTYSGGYEHFFSFKEQFNSLIDKREDLDLVQKFCYLRSALKGDALQVIQSLETIAVNYDKAWELLNSRFDNKRMVVGGHLREIFNTEKIDKASALRVRRFVDNISKHIRALESLELPVDKWDAPLVFYLQQRLDPNTLREWEETCDKNSIPTLIRFIEFLEAQAQILESLDSERPKDRLEKFRTHGKQHTSNLASCSESHENSLPFHSNTYVCPICGYRHKIYFCKKFLSMNVDERIKAAQDSNLCINCLKDGSLHSSQKCPSSHCPRCNLKHNSLLHKDDISSTSQSEQADLVNSSTTTHTFSSSVLLATAVVMVADKFENLHQCRVLLDNGSQVNLISEKMAQILGLTSYRRTSAICGIGGSKSTSHRGLNCDVYSKNNEFKISLECIILPKITLDLPTTSLDVSKWTIPTHVELADPDFFRKSPIQMLIGAGEFFNIVGIEQIPIGHGQPSLVSTRFGWVVSGKVLSDTAHEPDVGEEFGCSLGLEESLTRFWDVEELCSTRTLNPEEQACELHFIETTRQDASGRFEVQLPIKPAITQLGNSKEVALKRFLSLERKLSRNQNLKDSYVSFMREYIFLKHMELVSDTVEPSPVYYMPHHCVTNEYSSTTKLRVVFDGSCKSSTGISLNDVLMVGPTIQDDLCSILMRFRQHKYVMTADITKMYRQVNISLEHRNLQRIFWRESPEHDLQIFTLNTVTYGTSPASYIATRCLKQLSINNAESFPQGAVAVGRDFYVDDYLGGCDSLEQALDLQRQVIAVTKSGGFELHKWCSNTSALIESISPNLRETKYVLNSQNPTAIKTLGVWWNPSTDVFKYSIHTTNQVTVTKRSILSEIARIFDPLGLLGPIILQAKLFMKELWKAQMDWDTELDSPLRDKWMEFRNQLTTLESLEIPRLSVICSEAPVEMHGFSDASECAYGASIYLRSQDEYGKFHVRLLCSKSRVAPAKTISIPRLELCGSLMLAQLAKKCFDALVLPSLSCHLWTDSTVVLAWISKPSGTWKTFVSNRVTEIHELSKNFYWHHTPGSDNPCDLLSRGLMPDDIIQSELWWHGPPWLSQTPDQWPSQPFLPENPPETKQAVSMTVISQPTKIIEFERFSNLNRLINAVVYALRFIDHLPNKPCVTGTITVAERERAIRNLIRIVQQEAFFKELSALRKRSILTQKGPLASLNPSLDQNGLIRVGGRLRNSKLEFDQQHQIILPSGHRFTYLLIKSFHQKHLHAGPQLLLTIVRQQYWPLHGNSIIRKVFHSCKTCFRHNPKSITQLMGDLPAERVQPARPFINCGVDYCGPIMIKSSLLRKSQPVKSYIVLFICLATKAVHTELVSDMSTTSFINALKRFYSRRGKSKNMFSDNGSNFVGAARELNQYISKVLKDPQLSDYVVSEQIIWHFIPPRAPHFGGIWESAIKSLKFHLKRVVGDALLTYEEMYTVLSMIEACLNSRPLIPTSNDPDDFSVITPGHFLIGDSMTAIVEPDMRPYKAGSLKRWARLQKMYQHFWDRWSSEYLSTLQVRQKWLTQQPNLPLNKLVLIKDDNTPPLKWNLGRVIETHAGKDGLVRVVSVKTVNGIFKRPLSKLCPLPHEEQESSENEECESNC